MIKRAICVTLFGLLAWLPMHVSAGTTNSALASMDGTPAKLADHLGKGKWVIVKVWASTCHVCSEYAQEMVAFHTAHKDKDATVLGIAVDGYANKQGVRGFIRKHQLNFPNLVDDGSTVGEIYGEAVGQPWMGWTPTYLLYDPNGEMMAQNIGGLRRADVETFIQSASTRVDP